MCQLLTLLFFGTIVGYNFVKYDALARVQRLQMRKELKKIALFSFFALFLVGYYFFQLQRTTQIVAVVFLSITLFQKKHVVIPMF